MLVLVNERIEKFFTYFIYDGPLILFDCQILSYSFAILSCNCSFFCMHLAFVSFSPINCRSQRLNKYQFLFFFLSLDIERRFFRFDYFNSIFPKVSFKLTAENNYCGIISSIYFHQVTRLVNLENRQ